MVKVTDIEQLKSLKSGDKVYIIKKGSDKFYQFAGIHPSKSFDGVVLIYDARITDSITVSKLNLEKGDLGDIYIGEYNDAEYLNYLIANQYDTAMFHFNEAKDLANYRFKQHPESLFDLRYMGEEKEEDVILVYADPNMSEDSNMFDGTRTQFANCFFSNADNYQIFDWCKKEKYTLTINGKRII